MSSPLLTRLLAPTMQDTHREAKPHFQFIHIVMAAEKKPLILTHNT